MPTTYTHDLFGKEVYRELPVEVQTVIRKYGHLYRIGLHGPDILFYYRIYKNKINQYGVKMHKEKAKAFFLRGLEYARKEQDDALLAYLLGFACHYLLDSQAHPVVNRIVEEHGPSHTLQEKELDRFLMLREGKDPFAFYPSDCIVPGRFAAEEIHKAIPAIPAIKIYQSLVMMKWTTNKMVYDCPLRYRIFMWIFRITGQEKNLGEHFMRKEPLKGIQVYLSELMERYDAALKEAPEVLCGFYSIVKEGKALQLSPRFDRTYNG